MLQSTAGAERLIPLEQSLQHPAVFTPFLQGMIPLLLPTTGKLDHVGGEGSLMILASSATLMSLCLPCLYGGREGSGMAHFRAGPRRQGLRRREERPAAGGGMGPAFLLCSWCHQGSSTPSLGKGGAGYCRGPGFWAWAGISLEG